MFESVLIANRGEIACRVIRTARTLGIRTTAVYSQADADALHVAMADSAVYIGPAPAAQSYLKTERLLDAARASGAAAIHPGYGFLAENAGFAQACEDAGIVFIGPTPEVMRLMGDKRLASLAMADAGVPVLPGYRGEAQDNESLTAAAADVGLPLMIKPSAGGGGKGMHVVTRMSDIEPALERARSEAAAAFGDDTLVLERFVERPRHVEVQVFGDTHGNVVHLYERECSLQRRHQKVIEECPAPGLLPESRERLCGTAVSAARSIGYRGAGTLEFLLDGRSAEQPFYFMEMNTRLQVEHPVTEMTMGADLVEWQLRVAAGEPLPLSQSSIKPCGHAMEARICAEDPDRGFLPVTGLLTRFDAPVDANATGTNASIRLDSGVSAGDTISIHYDSMIAKLVTHARDRGAARRLLGEALAATHIDGVTTNLELLRTLTLDEIVASGEQDTGFIERNLDGLLAGAGARLPGREQLLAAAAVVARLHVDTREGRRTAASTADPHSAWARLTGWRLNAPACETIVMSIEDAVDAPETRLAVPVRIDGDGYRVEIAGEALHLRVVTAPGAADGAGEWRMDIEQAGRRGQARITYYPQAYDAVRVAVRDGGMRAQFHSRDARSGTGQAAAGHLSAPMPGKIARVLVSVGESVQAGQALLVLEAMKMEHTIVAPAAGEVTALRFAPGELVAEGEELAAVEPAA